MPYITAGLLKSRLPDIPYLNWRPANLAGRPADCAYKMSKRERQMRVILRERKRINMRAQTNRMKIAEWFKGLEKDGMNVMCMDKAYLA